MHRLLTKHTCTSVQAQGWSGIKNGDLLQRAELEFDLFITSDQNIRYQQNLAGRRIAILELSSLNRWDALLIQPLNINNFADGLGNN